MFSAFNWQQMTSAFIVLFAVIDIIGSIPIIINLKEKGKDVNALKATLISFALLIGFFYAGDMMLKLFHVDIESFAVAGAFVIFLMSLEMILDIEIFKNQGPIKEATLGSAGLSAIGRSGSLYNFTLFACRICQYQYYHCISLEYDMGIFCCQHDREGRTFFWVKAAFILSVNFWHYPVSNFSAFVYGKYFIAVGQLSSLVLLFFFLCRRNCNSFP